MPKVFDLQQLYDFITESNKIERILREPTAEEIAATTRFLELNIPSIPALVKLVKVYQPDARFRNDPSIPGVRVGSHTAPASGKNIEIELTNILSRAMRPDISPHTIHCRYQYLHPFTDGNGRSGRALWAWQMLRHRIWPGIELGFLHPFYYQTLERSDRL